MEFRVLGALDIAADGVRIDLGGLTRRAVLGYLLLYPNQVVPTSQLRDALWQGDPPATARKIVQNAVSAIRKILPIGEPTRTVATLLTQPPGYLLRIDPHAVDLCRFRLLVEQGRAEIAAGSPAAALPPLRRGLQLWRGNALADLAEAGMLWSELSALEDERLNAYEDCFDAELACGKHREITPELEMLTATAPLREGLYRQYMLALYRCGRQVDALNVYQRSRASLVEGVGVEPGRDLRRLHQMILSQDDALQIKRFRSPA